MSKDNSKLKKIILYIKNLYSQIFDIKDNLLLYLCNGESLPEILNDEEDRHLYYPLFLASYPMRDAGTR